jgi:hypothetical protein
MIYLVTYRVAYDERYLIGAFQDLEFAQAYINELIQAGDQIHQIMGDFNADLDDFDEEGNINVGTDEEWMTKAQSQIDEVIAKVEGMLSKHSSARSKGILQSLREGNNTVMDWFNSDTKNQFSIDEIELVVPNMMENRKNNLQEQKLRRHFKRFTGNNV